MQDVEITELAKEMKGRADESEVTDAKSKALKARRDGIKNRELPEAMDNAEIDKFSVEGVGTIYLKQMVFSNVRKDDREKFYAWLRENGHEDLVVEYVWPNTQKAFVKEALEDGRELPDFLNATFGQQVQLRRK